MVSRTLRSALNRFWDMLPRPLQSFVLWWCGLFYNKTFGLLAFIFLISGAMVVSENIGIIMKDRWNAEMLENYKQMNKSADMLNKTSSRLRKRDSLEFEREYKSDSMDLIILRKTHLIDSLNYELKKLKE